MQKSIFFVLVAVFTVSAAFAQVRYEGRAGIGYAAVVGRNGVKALLPKQFTGCG